MSGRGGVHGDVIGGVGGASEESRAMVRSGHYCPINTRYVAPKTMKIK